MICLLFIKKEDIKDFREEGRVGELTQNAARFAVNALSADITRVPTHPQLVVMCEIGNVTRTFMIEKTSGLKQITLEALYTGDESKLNTLIPATASDGRTSEKGDIHLRTLLEKAVMIGSVDKTNPKESLMVYYM